MTLHQQRVQGAYGVSLIPLLVLANKYDRTPRPDDQLQLFFKKLLEAMTRLAVKVTWE